jgi:hypothetical protein
MKKELVKIIPKSSFAEIFLHNTQLTFDDKVALFLEWVPDMDIPDEITTSELLLDFVYKTYLDAIDKYSLNKSISNIKRKDGGESRKDFIINFISTKGEVTYKELYEAVDQKWHYEEVGKTPRVRINNTLKELLSKQKIARDGELIIWKGK